MFKINFKQGKVTAKMGKNPKICCQVVPLWKDTHKNLLSWNILVFWLFFFCPQNGGFPLETTDSFTMIHMRVLPYIAKYLFLRREEGMETVFTHLWDLISLAMPSAPFQQEEAGAGFGSHVPHRAGELPLRALLRKWSQGPDPQNIWGHIFFLIT